MANEETLSNIASAIDKQGAALNTFVAEGRKTLDSIVDRVEMLEARSKSPGRTFAAEKEGHEHVVRFNAWLRRPRDASTKSKLEAFERDTKSVVVATASDGGHAVPEEISREIERLEKKFSPVRDLVRVEQASTGDYKKLVNIRGTASGWVGESGTRLETATSQLREVAPTFGEIYAYPQASEWSLDDIFFNVGDWLAEEVAQEFALQEGTAVISGNGVSKPTGMLNTSPVSTADFATPLRPAAAYEFVVSMSSEPSPRAAAVMPDALIDLVYRVASQYRQGATWAMNSTTAAAVRKLKDSSGQYLWQQGFGGEPDRLLGYPTVFWEQLDDIAANAHPIAFGDFRSGYLLNSPTCT